MSEPTDTTSSEPLSYKVGDCVRFRIGGPRMLVRDSRVLELRPPTPERWGYTVHECAWFVKGELQEDCFRADELVLDVEEPELPSLGCPSDYLLIEKIMSTAARAGFSMLIHGGADASRVLAAMGAEIVAQRATIKDFSENLPGLLRAVDHVLLWDKDPDQDMDGLFGAMRSARARFSRPDSADVLRVFVEAVDELLRPDRAGVGPTLGTCLDAVREARKALS